MKRSREESQRWFKQSEYDFEAARRNFEQKIYSYACFIAEQAAQKALKSFLILKGERYVWEHPGISGLQSQPINGVYLSWFKKVNSFT